MALKSLSFLLDFLYQIEPSSIADCEKGGIIVLGSSHVLNLKDFV